MTAATLRKQIADLKLRYVAEEHQALAKQAIEKRWTHLEYLEHLIEGENLDRHCKLVERIRKARLPVVKTLEGFDWSWPTKIDQAHVRDVFRLGFIEKKANVVFAGTVGTGKTHLLLALAYQACQRGHSVLYTTGIEALNRLVAAKAAYRLRNEIKRYARPDVVAIDEWGYLPADKPAADLMFQLVSQRYNGQGCLLLTTNKEYKAWPEIFANDAGLTSAILDRVLHRCETIAIEGPSYRMKNHVENQRP